MYQPAPAEFAATLPLAELVRRRARHRLLLLKALVAVALLGAGVGYWWFRVCGTCAPPIVCAKRCAHIDRAIEQMMQQQRPKLPDRIEPQ